MLNHLKFDHNMSDKDLSHLVELNRKRKLNASDIESQKPLTAYFQSQLSQNSDGASSQSQPEESGQKSKRDLRALKIFVRFCYKKLINISTIEDCTTKELLKEFKVYRSNSAIDMNTIKEVLCIEARALKNNIKSSVSEVGIVSIAMCKMILSANERKIMLYISFVNKDLIHENHYLSCLSESAVGEPRYPIQFCRNILEQYGIIEHKVTLVSSYRNILQRNVEYRKCIGITINSILHNIKLQEDLWIVLKKVLDIFKVIYFDNNQSTHLDEDDDLKKLFDASQTICKNKH